MLSLCCGWKIGTSRYTGHQSSLHRSFLVPTRAPTTLNSPNLFSAIRVSSPFLLRLESEQKEGDPAHCPFPQLVLT